MSFARPRLYTPAFKVARALQPLVREEREKGLDVVAPKVIAALNGNGSAFWALDEQPGSYGGYDTPDGYAGLLRRVRNSPVWGPRMFATFKR